MSPTPYGPHVTKHFVEASSGADCAYQGYGVGHEPTAIAAVVIGGTLLTGGSGSMGGTACGVLLLAAVHNLTDHYFSQCGPAFTDAVNGGFLAVVVLLQTLLSRTQQLE